MNYLIASLLALVPLVWGAEFQNIAEEEQRSISSQVAQIIKDLKEQMPCGFPELHIPPLAPLKITFQVIEIEYEGIQIYGEIRNFSLVGLNNFDIVELKINTLLRRANFKLNWNNVYFKTNYDLSTAKDGQGVRRSGQAKFSIKNFTVWGVLKYNSGLISDKQSVKEFSVYVSLAEVKSEIDGLSKIPILNKILNRIIEELFMIIVNDNTNQVAEITNNMVVPVLNDILSDTSLPDILGILVDKEPCLPPEDLDLM